jgi:hypothetical protein
VFDDLAPELRNVGSSVGAELEIDEEFDLPAEFRVIENRGLALDDSFGSKALNSPPAWGVRKADDFRNVGHAS